MISIAQALLGSSASNLYRSACLRERPFPADYGTAGDCAWGLAHALRVDIAVTPGVFSTFREHQKAYAPSAYAVADLVLRLEALAEQAFAVATQADAALAAAPEASVIAALLRAREQIRVNQRALSAIRKSAGLPWFLRPRAWQARGRRNAGREAFDREARRLLRDLSHRPVDPGQLADLPYLEWARSG